LCAFCVPIAARLLKFALALDLCCSMHLAGAWNHPSTGVGAAGADCGILTDEQSVRRTFQASTMLLPDS
jgi:hypothetical protein